MRKSYLVSCWFALILGLVIGCQSADKQEAAASSQAVESGAAYSEPQPGPGIEGYQYRAVCIEKEAHGGTPYVLSRWLSDRGKAFALGKYHTDHKEKGHRWILEERVKPEANQP